MFDNEKMHLHKTVQKLLFSSLNKPLLATLHLGKKVVEDAHDIKVHRHNNIYESVDKDGMNYLVLTTPGYYRVTYKTLIDHIHAPRRVATLPLTEEVWLTKPHAKLDYKNAHISLAHRFEESCNTDIGKIAFTTKSLRSTSFQ